LEREKAKSEKHKSSKVKKDLKKTAQERDPALGGKHQCAIAEKCVIIRKVNRGSWEKRGGEAGDYGC